MKGGVYRMLTFRQGTEESGAERSLVEKRRTRGGKTADEQQS